MWQHLTKFIWPDHVPTKHDVQDLLFRDMRQGSFVKLSDYLLHELYVPLVA